MGATEPDRKQRQFTREELEAELAKVTEQAHSARFAAELAKFHEEQRRRDEESRRLGNE